EGDSMGSNSTEAPPPVAEIRSSPAEAAALVVLRYGKSKEPSSAGPTSAAEQQPMPNPFVDDSGSYRKEGMPGNGALIPKGGEFSLQRKPTSCAVGTTAPPPTTADVFARMRMLGQKCKNDSGRHKLRRDPVTGKKLLVLR
ncbi:hypothetical protein FOZ62_017293, partial [Perkinsus olseni]